MDLSDVPNDALLRFYNEHYKDKEVTLASMEVILALLKEINELKKGRNKTHG